MYLNKDQKNQRNKLIGKDLNNFDIPSLLKAAAKKYKLENDRWSCHFAGRCDECELPESLKKLNFVFSTCRHMIDALAYHYKPNYRRIYDEGEIK